VDDQAGFDGFAKTHFICQQDPRHQSPGHFCGDIKLVGNEIDAAADKSTHWGFSTVMLISQCSHPQIEHFRRIKPTGQQALLGFAKTDGIAQFRFW
jgi:hypothetical protein